MLEQCNNLLALRRMENASFPVERFEPDCLMVVMVVWGANEVSVNHNFSPDQSQECSVMSSHSFTPCMFCPFVLDSCPFQAILISWSSTSKPKTNGTWPFSAGALFAPGRIKSVYSSQSSSSWPSDVHPQSETEKVGNYISSIYTYVYIYIYTHYIYIYW